MAAYSTARRMTSLLWIQAPSSVIATTPFSYSEPILLSCSPSMPSVMQAVGNTLITAFSPIVFFTRARMPTLSTGGLVFGMHTIEVNPPAAAAWVPEPISSLCVWPGSRRWTCMSTKPGQTMQLLASMRWA